MGFEIVFGVLLLGCLQVICVTTYKVHIVPDHVRVTEEPSVVTVTCSAGIPLDGCQFKWWDFYEGEGPILELDRGAESTSEPAHLSERLTSYTYSGRGLEAGDCGVTLHVEGWKTWMIACRVKAKRGAWSYKWTDLYAQGWGALPTFVTPREAVAMPGGLAKFLALTKHTSSSTGSLTSCHFFLPDVGRLVLDDGVGSANSTKRHEYYGLGLDRGECGLTLRGVTAEQNGLVRVWVANDTGSVADTALMALIVARPPSDNVKMTMQREGNSTMYTCVVDGRPLPGTITWTLEGEVIRQDGVNDHPGGPDDAWHWPWLDRHMEQRVTVGHRPEDEGKTVKCSFSNQALRWPVFGSYGHHHATSSPLTLASTTRPPPTTSTMPTSKAPTTSAVPAVSVYSQTIKTTLSPPPTSAVPPT